MFDLHTVSGRSIQHDHIRHRAGRDRALHRLDAAPLERDDDVRRERAWGGPRFARATVCPQRQGHSWEEPARGSARVVAHGPPKHSIMETSFRDESGRKYKWKGHIVSGLSALELFTKDDEYTHPVARFDRSRETSDRQEEPATLALTRRALEIRNLVVISFGFVEDGRRKEEAWMRPRGNPQGDLPPLAIASYGRAVVGSG